MHVAACMPHVSTSVYMCQGNHNMCMYTNLHCLHVPHVHTVTQPKYICTIEIHAIYLLGFISARTQKIVSCICKKEECQYSSANIIWLHEKTYVHSYRHAETTVQVEGDFCEPCQQIPHIPYHLTKAF